MVPPQRHRVVSNCTSLNRDSHHRWQSVHVPWQSACWKIFSQTSGEILIPSEPSPSLSWNSFRSISPLASRSAAVNSFFKYCWVTSILAEWHRKRSAGILSSVPACSAKLWTVVIRLSCKLSEPSMSKSKQQVARAELPVSSFPTPGS